MTDVAGFGSVGGVGEYVLLRDGGQIFIRPYSLTDRPAIEEFFGGLSPESRGLRFHSGGARLSDDSVNRATSGHALVAARGDHIVALASYYRLRDPERAEMAIAVDDAEQGRGIGTALFERLSRDARRDGIRRFLALVLASNRNMLELLRGLGFQMTRTMDHGELEVDVVLKEEPAYVERADARRHVAAAASLDPIFQPRAIAVIGASRRAGSIGYALFRNLLTGGYEGTVYPVNPSATSVATVRAYPTVAMIPDRIDLGIIVVPAISVLAAARDCLDAGVRGLVVISAGFAEVGPEGRERQNELLRMCRSAGVRLIGPNCMGILTTGALGTLNGTFAPTLPPAGHVAVASQSGALGIAILQEARNLGIGISSFVSMGNKADVSSNDLLECWEDDPAIGVILLYLESFGNPRRFARVARRVGTRKPIIAVKGGRGKAGQRAAASHTAAMAGSETAVNALFRQAGVTRCDTLEELFDLTTLLSSQPLPEGNRVGIITNAGGLGILCADACEANGLEIPSLSAETQAKLRQFLPAEASVGNPVDMLASGSAESYGQVLQTVLADREVDAAIVLFIPPLVTNAADVAHALVAARDPAATKPLLTCFVGAQGIPEILRGKTSIPSYRFPEAAARALGHAAQRSTWLRRPVGQSPAFADIDREAARAIVGSVVGRQEPIWLKPDEARSMLHAYGIRMPDELRADSAAEAAEATRRLGPPVAVKLVSETILHKSDVGGVRLGLTSPEAAGAAYEAISDSLRDRGLDDAMQGVTVQAMIHGGVECLVGVVTDPTFGPLIAFGLGGVEAEVLGDVEFRLHPLTDVDADELIDESRASRLMRGFRGAPPADVGALRDLLLRISRLVDDVPEIAELDLNPVVVLDAGHGARALDARIRISPSV